MKLGIVFSGGGVKGIAHSGALKVLEEEKIIPDVFAGTSSGSHVAFLSAIGYSADEIKQKYDLNIDTIVGRNSEYDLKKYLFKKEFKLDGLRTGKGIEKFYYDIGKENGIDKISDVAKPLGIIATDLKHEKEVWFTSKKVDDSYSLNKINITNMNIGKVIRASSSFSVLFDPCRVEEEIYLDGGIFNNTPVNLARALGADKVLAIKFEDDSHLNFDNLNMISIGLRTLDMMSRVVSNRIAETADVIVKIKANSKNLLDVDNSEAYYKAGYIAMKEKINEVKNMYKNL